MSKALKTLRPGLDAAVDSYLSGEATGAIGVFEWCIREITTMSSGGHVTSDAIVRRLSQELDRRFPEPRRTL